MMGIMHELGLGQEKNTSTALDFFHVAAKEGCLDSLNSIGKIAEEQSESLESLSQAKEAYLKASQGGNLDAMVNLGHLLEKTANESSDNQFQQAAKWYLKAANGGYARAQNAIGSCFYKGKGVNQNFDLAIEWFRKAASQVFFCKLPILTIRITCMR